MSAFPEKRKNTNLLLERKKGEKTMKSTGIVRNVDELGRIVIPKEIRTNMSITNNDAVEIFVDGEKIILTKYQPTCMFCDAVEDITYFKGKKICRKCLEELRTKDI